MDLHRLEVFSKLMETGSFSRTGQELGLTQPTVSGHIKSLEQIVGLTLFDRHKRQVRPTSAALVLYEYAQRILELRDEAGYALEKFRGQIAGRLRLGGSTIPGTYILPPLIGRFRRLYDQTFLTMVLGGTESIAERVARGDLEMGVVGAMVEHRDLQYDALVDDEMVLAIPARPPWNGWIEPYRALTVKQLRSLPFVIREEGSGTRAMTVQALERKGVFLKDLQVVAELGGTEAVRQAVKAGLGASILSRVAVAEDVDAGRLRAYKVKGLDLSRRFFMVTNTRRTKSPVCSAFLDFIKAESRKSGFPNQGLK